MENFERGWGKFPFWIGFEGQSMKTTNKELKKDSFLTLLDQGKRSSKLSNFKNSQYHFFPKKIYFSKSSPSGNFGILWKRYVRKQIHHSSLAPKIKYCTCSFRSIPYTPGGSLLTSTQQLLFRLCWYGPCAVSRWCDAVWHTSITSTVLGNEPCYLLQVDT